LSASYAAYVRTFTRAVTGETYPQVPYAIIIQARTNTHSHALFRCSNGRTVTLFQTLDLDRRGWIVLQISKTGPRGCESNGVRSCAANEKTSLVPIRSKVLGLVVSCIPFSGRNMVCFMSKLSRNAVMEGATNLAGVINSSAFGVYDRGRMLPQPPPYHIVVTYWFPSSLSRDAQGDSSVAKNFFAPVSRTRSFWKIRLLRVR